MAKTKNGRVLSSVVGALLVVISSVGIAAAECSFNTADGTFALANVTSGCDDSAFGYQALLNDTTGGENTAVGVNALVGSSSLWVTGSSNTAVGMSALNSDSTGSNNTAVGRLALQANTSGHNNIAVGYEAGENLTTGNNDIDIGNAGVGGESDKIRIGTSGTQTAAYIAGISGAPMSTGDVVVVDSAGQLGVFTSSARYKRDIQAMGGRSQGLLKLRPVTFRYKQDPQGERQYGLIAEEVAQVYPELVGHGPDGKVQTVRYHELIPMLLNELQHEFAQLQRQQREISELKQQKEQIGELKRENQALRATLAGLQQRLDVIAPRTAAWSQR